MANKKLTPGKALRLSNGNWIPHEVTPEQAEASRLTGHTEVQEIVWNVYEVEGPAVGGGRMRFLQ